MAKIKSFTDLDQSKKLAEILPLETADMHYILEDFVDEDTGDIFSIEKISFGHPSNTEIGCWSLATLLNVFEDKGFFYKLYFDGVFNVLEVVNIDNPSIYEINYNDYLVDACVDVIIKLHELKML